MIFYKYQLINQYQLFYELTYVIYEKKEQLLNSYLFENNNYVSLPGGTQILRSYFATICFDHIKYTCKKKFKKDSQKLVSVDLSLIKSMLMDICSLRFLVYKSACICSIYNISYSDCNNSI